ncbi:MAG: hypothetical protein Tsb0018_02280 [Opitutales bacterium]|tara:strand:+ start:5194 stop:5760 length:567 start_codon:yes stop_codon:yes gene_type:complete
MAEEEQKPEENSEENKPEENKEETPKGSNPWIPLAIVLVLFPALSYALMEFVFIPRMMHILETATAKGSEHAASSAESEHAEVEGSAESLQQYKFNSVVANLSGSMQSRYLKVSFMVESSDPNLTAKIESNKAKLTDNALSILSAMSLHDLEEPGIKNILRSDLINAFNSSLKGKVIKQLYFYEFVVQ